MLSSYVQIKVTAYDANKIDGFDQNTDIIFKLFYC